MREGRYTAFDIGTVTCRMLVADVLPGGVLIPRLKEYAITNLGEGVDATHHLSNDAMDRVADILDAFLAVRNTLPKAEHNGCPLPVIEPRVVATSASRDADNVDEFARLLEQRGLTLDVIPGFKEAELTFIGASSAYVGEQVAVVDVGGGSTEIGLGCAGHMVKESHSFDIGCRRVTERFLHADPPDSAELACAQEWVQEQFASWYAHDVSSKGVSCPERMIAVAGTATSAVSMRDQMEVYDSERVDGALVTREELDCLFNKLAALTLSERQYVVGLDPGRAPVIVAGMLILREALRVFHMDSFTVSEADILQGIIMDTYKQS